ncbi:formate dehydrogenase accessory sulfurtransferase FdhD [Actinosynnema pretiosum subsp. pretiosum]|uniref:Sulfur carrier protein FdhD n=2 Tax=Actinosynnema TaxID=40566 RepID=C6WQ56_ACTMD|nr:formate dehydrogenase accessory sulfurtransferase FdhD [Actinosynnema mirum]ACU35112.1 formate dehydrogenase family accessory protein FdhD [Actinosynnema mirum DSM 43827]AXX28468.1 Formate dehydrogenase chain D [Actinosynnema pretiosum subsp. pretiosum]QUF07186.1 formate dehydrogenase accessory sulfurtransferase FdhD [Actinosynnema pretiosum subsp. pretiosum]
MGRVTVRRPVVTYSRRAERRKVDSLAAEEPLELRVNGRALAVTMRTPGKDVELAHGFLLSEGVIGHLSDVAVARFCEGTGPDGENTYNVLDLTLAEGVPPPEVGVERNFYTTSSCGVCGKAALDAVKLKTRFSPAGDSTTVDVDVLTALPDDLRERQKVFASTGGLHAAGLFTADGQALVVREDVGRHNAVDKVLGWAVLNDRIPLTGTVLMVSGRASFELVQKAAMAGVPLLAAVSAPSSLAADLAEEQGVTLVGFLRGDSMNVYTGHERVTA